MRILPLFLLAFVSSSVASAQSSAPAESRPIFRHIQLSRDTVELGRPLGALLRFARTPSDTIVTIPLGEFGGTDAIRVYRRTSGEVTQMLFLYGPRHSMSALRDGYIEDLGPPQFVEVDSVQGIARQTWVWRDARTVFRLTAFATPIDGIAGIASMQDREARSP